MNRTWKFVAFLIFVGICATMVNTYPIGEENSENLLKPTIITPPQKLTFSLFEAVVIPCKIENAANERIVWKFSGYNQDSLTLSFNGNVIFPPMFDNLSIPNLSTKTENDHSLHIKNFTLNLVGSYTCEIFSKNIAVSHDVRLEDEPPRIMNVDEGANFSLPCHPGIQYSNFDQVPSGKDFEWVIPNVPIYSNGRLSSFLSMFNAENKNFDLNQTALIIRQIQYVKEVLTFTCRFPQLYTNFTHVVQVNKNLRKTWK